MSRFALVGSLALCAGASVLAAAPPLPDAVPIEAFASLPEMEGAKLSPDGTKIASKMSVGGKQVLVVHPIFGSGRPSGLAVSDVDLNWWSWVNDHWLVVGIDNQDRLYGTEVYARRIIGVSADTKTVNRIDTRRTGVAADDVIWIARDGSPRLLLSKSTGIVAKGSR